MGEGRVSDDDGWVSDGTTRVTAATSSTAGSAGRSGPSFLSRIAAACSIQEGLDSLQMSNDVHGMSSGCAAVVVVVVVGVAIVVAIATAKMSVVQVLSEDDGGGGGGGGAWLNGPVDEALCGCFVA